MKISEFYIIRKKNTKNSRTEKIKKTPSQKKQEKMMTNFTEVTNQIYVSTLDQIVDLLHLGKQSTDLSYEGKEAKRRVTDILNHIEEPTNSKLAKSKDKIANRIANNLNAKFKDRDFIKTALKELATPAQTVLSEIIGHNLQLGESPTTKENLFDHRMFMIAMTYSKEETEELNEKIMNWSFETKKKRGLEEAEKMLRFLNCFFINFNLLSMEAMDTDTDGDSDLDVMTAAEIKAWEIKRKGKKQKPVNQPLEVLAEELVTIQVNPFKLILRNDIENPIQELTTVITQNRMLGGSAKATAEKTLWKALQHAREEKDEISDQQLKEIFNERFTLIESSFDDFFGSFDTIDAGEFLHDDWVIVE